MADKTFKQAYGILQEHADTLRNQREPNIDDLLTIVTESVAAYKVCKERIDAVEKALEQTLSSAGVVGRGENEDETPSASSPKHPAFEDDEDIPF